MKLQNERETLSLERLNETQDCGRERRHESKKQAGGEQEVEKGDEMHGSSCQPSPSALVPHGLPSQYKSSSNPTQEPSGSLEFGNFFIAVVQARRGSGRPCL